MFKINRKTDYAVRVMLCLARRPPNTRLPTQAIQNEMLIPRAFLQQIIASLSQAGLVQTYLGPNGGLELARSADAINLRHIWEATAGKIMISECLEAPGKCPMESTCPVRSRWGNLQAVIIGELESTSLRQLALEADKLTSLPPVFEPVGSVLAKKE